MSIARRTFIVVATYMAVLLVAASFVALLEKQAYAEPHQHKIIFACFPEKGEPYFVEFPQTVVVLHQKIQASPWNDPDADDGTDTVGGIIYVDMDGNKHVAYINKRDRCLKLGYKTEV